MNMLIVKNPPPCKKLIKMSRFSYLFLSLAILSASCAKDPVEDSTVDKEKVTLSLETYAVNNDANASENELVIKSAYVYIFNAADVLENPGKTSVPLDSSTGECVDGNRKLNKTWSVYSGQKTIYVILNAGSVKSGNSAISLATYTPASKAELEKLMTDAASFDTDFLLNGTNGLLMSGKVVANVTPSASTVAANVVRRYVRIDLSLRRGDMWLLNKSVIVKSVKFKNQRHTAHLISPAAESTGEDFDILDDFTDISLEDDEVPVCKFYTMSRIGAAKAACLEMLVEVAGIERTVPVYINSGALNGNKANDENAPLDLAANKIYKVTVTYNDPGIDVDLSIVDWNDQSVGGDIYGASMSVTNDQCLIYEDGTRVTGWDGDTYTIAEANYIYDGTVPSEVNNSITVEGAGMSLKSAGKLTAAKAPVQVLLGPTFSTGTVTLKFGNITKTVKVVLKDAVDAHFSSIVCDGQTTGAEWTRNDNFCFAQNEGSDKFVICIPENVTPTGWINYNHEDGTSTVSNADDADAEPLFEQKKAEGIIYRSDLGATKVFIRQVAPVYLGHFGSPVTSGDLTAVDDGGYSKKRLIAEVIEENSSNWASANVQFYTRFSEFDEGLKIAEYLKNNNDAAAVKYCLLKNDRNGNGVLDPDEPIRWYLPALKELFGAWISYEPLRLSNDQFYRGSYWSSTESSAGRAHTVNFDSSGSSYYPVDYTFYVRCVRSL